MIANALIFIQFPLNDKSTLRMGGMVTNKNKQIVGFLYPRFRYLHRPLRTQIECGFSLGSISRRMIGLSHVLSQKRSCGYHVEYCALQRKIHQNFSYKERLTDSNAFLTTTLSTASEIGGKTSSIKNDTAVKVKYTKQINIEDSILMRSVSKLSCYLSLSPFSML